MNVRHVYLKEAELAILTGGASLHWECRDRKVKARAIGQPEVLDVHV